MATSVSSQQTPQRREAYRVRAAVILLGMDALPQQQRTRRTPRWRMVSLSPKGVGLRVRRPFDRGDAVYLDLSIPGHGNHIISCTAAVANCLPRTDGSFELGLEFRQIAPEDVARIERFSTAWQRKVLRERVRARASDAPA